jgi:hypothetical protein
MNFQVGKKYPMRSKAVAVLIGPTGAKGDDKALVWLDVERDATFTTDKNGVYVRGSEAYRDIISDEPIREPVKVTNHWRFGNVYEDGTVWLYPSRDQANDASNKSRIGLLELPIEIEVTPV